MNSIYTSIAPRRISAQFKAISSWERLGFQVISLNNPDEIEQLQGRFKKVTFLPVNRNGQDVYGRPLVFLDDIFAAFGRRSEQTLAIINSDISLNPKFGTVKDQIYQASKGGLAFGPRIDRREDKSETPYFNGFDYFFVDRNLIPLYSKTKLAIGATWWDYWMVIKPILHGVTPQLINLPLAIHQHHPIAWDKKNLLITIQQVIANLPIDIEGADNVDFSTENEYAISFARSFAIWTRRMMYSKSGLIFPQWPDRGFHKNYKKYTNHLFGRN